MNFESVVKKWEKIEPDYMGSELYVHIRENYLAICPKCKQTLSYDSEHLSNFDYLGACLDCDEDFYAIECTFKPN